MSRFASLMDKVIRVGDGRGFVVEGRDRSLVITASHCLPHLPPRHPAAHMHERMHRNLLGRLGSELTVWTEVLFVSPILNDDGAAIGALCSGRETTRDGGPNPCLAAHLPGWLAGKLLAPTIITAEKKLAARMSKGMFDG